MRLIFFVMAICMFLTGCNSKLSTILLGNVAEIREFALYGNNDNMSASLMCGMRECEYKINGYATDLQEFGIITVNLQNQKYVQEDIEFCMFVGTKKFTGVFEINPFDNTLVADIKKRVDYDSNVTLIVYFSSGEQTLKLKKVDDEWSIDIYDALDIFVEKNKNKIKSLCKGKSFDGEVYIKIMNDEIGLSKDFYFLISMYGRKGESLNMIVSPLNGEILASNGNM